MPNSRAKEQGTNWEIRRADNYNQIGWVRDQAFRDRIVAACGGGDAAISLGCGTGPILGLLRGKFRRLVGVDASKAMLAAGDFHGIETQCMRIEDIPWQREFDLAEMRNVLHSVDDPQRAMQVALQVLKPGGRLVLVEGVPPDHRVRATYEKLFEQLEDRHTFSEGDLVALARRAGFADITVQPYFMENVDLLDWIQKVAPTPEAGKEVERIHRTADEHFWRVYEMREEGRRLLMTWRFCLLTATRPMDGAGGSARKAIRRVRV